MSKHSINSVCESQIKETKQVKQTYIRKPQFICIHVYNKPCRNRSISRLITDDKVKLTQVNTQMRARLSGWSLHWPRKSSAAALGPRRRPLWQPANFLVATFTSQPDRHWEPAAADAERCGTHRPMPRSWSVASRSSGELRALLRRHPHNAW